MNRFEPNLRIPGPTGLPPSVRAAGGRQMINHRGPEFAAMLDRIMTGMKPYFGTTSDIAMLSCAGTGGLEAAVVNTLSPGDRVLAVTIGSFGDRFAKIATTYGADVDRSWTSSGARRPTRRGPRAALAASRAGLQGGPAYPQRDLDRGHEPDPGARRRDPRGRRPTRCILVDSVSALGAVPFEMDAWGVDIVITGSQKAWMAAPGLAMVAASDRPGRRWRRRRCRASTSTSAPIATRTPRARRRGRRRSPSSTRSTRASSSWSARARRRVFARHAACAAAARAGLRGARLRAVRRPALRLSDGDRRSAPRRARLEGVQRRGQAARGRPGRWPGQAGRADLPARSPRLGHPRRDPRRDRRHRGGLARAPSRGRARERPSAPPSAPRSRRWARSGRRRPSGREDPRRRTRRPRGPRAPARPARGRRAARPRPRTSMRRSCPTTTRSSCAARSRSMPG